MKRFIISMFMLFTLLLISSISYAQPAHLPPPPPGYHYERICYTSLVPFPHSQCDYKLVRHHRVVVPYRYHHYRPAPPPPHHGPRQGHHPPPPPHHGHRH